MKIHSSQPLHQAMYKKATEKAQLNAQATTKQDQVEISEEARELSHKSDSAREQKIEQLKAQIENGTYQIQPEKIADAFYRAWNKGD